ncbi:CDGSH iron-sulfur domain-containing protein [Streptomyces sp. NPDC097619]|uniref:CDGSH iron-sulfur domain-containing protein n=1 Tax=Streptomyces sp. NPDC097619 TaxID=3157228 RepID=UPI00332F8795
MPSDSDRPGPDRSKAQPAPRRVTVDPQGPVVVEGPVEVLLDDGEIVRSDRFRTAICTCRRSRTFPWCDTSHRPRARPAHSDEDRSTS